MHRQDHSLYAKVKDMTEKMGELINSSFLGSYSGLLSLSDLPMVILSNKAKPMHEFNPMPDFCKRICPKGRNECCAEVKARMAQLRPEGERFTCSQGLTCFLVPVDGTNEDTAVVSGGYVFPLEEEYRKYILDVNSFSIQSGLDVKAVATACALLRNESQERMENHEHLCRFIAQSIARHLHGLQQPLQSVEKDMLERKIIQQEASRDISIHPDFLFNMLNCVARTAYFEHAEKTENLIYCLSDILRFNSQRGNSIHTIQAELEHIEKYLFIQKMRFQSRLKYTIDVPEYIRNCHILNSVLQPLVDNAIVHGILLRKDGGEIRLKAETHVDSIVFYIMDNGHGFSQEVLNDFERGRLVNGKSSELVRINKSLKDFYGKKYGIEIVKTDAGGSTVSVLIPRSKAVR